jgi:transposase
MEETSSKRERTVIVPPELKQEMINKVLLEGRSRRSVSLDFGLPNQGILSNWLAQYRKKLNR